MKAIVYFGRFCFWGFLCIVFGFITSCFLQKNNTRNTVSTNYIIEFDNAKSLFEAQNYDASFESFSKLKLNYPDSIALDFYLGLNHFYSNNYEKALSYLDNAVSTKKYEEKSMWYIALSLIKLNQKTKAMHLLKEIVKTSGAYANKADQLLKELRD